MILLSALLLAAPPATPTPAVLATPAAAVLRAKDSTAPGPGSSDSLAAAAKRIKLRLPADHPRVINNDTVRQLSEGVELTTSKATQPAGSTAAPPSNTEGRKAVWQRRYVDALARVARLEAAIARLQSEANLLQTNFYATDDPARRDGVIKPAWDKALADLKAAEKELESARGDPDRVLDAARRDGALPGWFRGLDEKTSLRTSEAGSGESVGPGHPAPNLTENAPPKT